MASSQTIFWIGFFIPMISLFGLYTSFYWWLNKSMPPIMDKLWLIMSSLGLLISIFYMGKTMMRMWSK